MWSLSASLSSTSGSKLASSGSSSSFSSPATSSIGVVGAGTAFEADEVPTKLCPWPSSAAPRDLSSALRVFLSSVTMSSGSSDQQAKSVKSGFMTARRVSVSRASWLRSRPCNDSPEIPSHVVSSFSKTATVCPFQGWHSLLLLVPSVGRDFQLSFPVPCETLRAQKLG